MLIPFGVSPRVRNALPVSLGRFSWSWHGIAPLTNMCAQGSKTRHVLRNCWMLVHTTLPAVIDAEFLNNTQLHKD